MVDYSVRNYNTYSPLLNYSYYMPSFYGIPANTKQAHCMLNYNSQPDSITFGNNKQITLTKPEKEGLATGTKVAIGVAVLTTLAIGTDFLFCKGKHVKSLWGKPKGNKSKPEVKPEVKPEGKPEVKPEVKPEGKLEINSDNSTGSTVFSKALEEATGIKPIKSIEEYNTVLQRLKQKEEWGDNLYGWYKNPLISRQNVQNYPTCRDIEKGVIAYAGYDDIHIALNSFLSGRTLPEDFSKQMGEDFTKLVDYSLKNMDKTFTPYNGVTYRTGFFDPKVKQYYSTSKSPKKFPYGNKCGQHTMFVSKRGHDIEAFQKAKNISANRQSFIDEHEVLMDVSADYRELVDLTPELIEKKLEYAKIILMERKEPLTEENIRKIISEIKVFEEI